MPLSILVDFVFRSVFKVPFQLSNVHFDFLLFFIMTKLQFETRKTNNFQAGLLLVSFFSLKAAVIFRVAKMRKNCPFFFFFTESLFQRISIF